MKFANPLGPVVVVLTVPSTVEVFSVPSVGVSEGTSEGFSGCWVHPYISAATSRHTARAGISDNSFFIFHSFLNFLHFTTLCRYIFNFSISAVTILLGKHCFVNEKMTAAGEIFRRTPVSFFCIFLIYPVTELLTDTVNPAILILKFPGSSDEAYGQGTLRIVCRDRIAG